MPSKRSGSRQRRPHTAPGDGSVDGHVRVAVRVRPLLPDELAQQCTACVSHPQPNTVRVGSTHLFTYDYAFPSDTTQNDTYRSAVQPLVRSCFEGINVTVMAYGQTGSGKTYTMGSVSLDAMDAEPGIIPQFVNDVFARIDAETKRGVRTFKLSVSFLEIYNEDIKDLLDPRADHTSSFSQRHNGRFGSAPEGQRSLQLREEAGGVVVMGLKEVSVDSVQAVMDVLQMGAARRTTAATLMNSASSRSHAVFTVTVESNPAAGSDAEDSDAVSATPAEIQADPIAQAGRMVSKLTFVDLAGSERLKRTGAQGDRMREGISINVGLLALGNVINALGDDRKRHRPQHIPYRVSKLTRMLQNALGGNSRTLFIACVSPADSNLEETLNTLRYAYRARNIRNTPVVNMDKHSERVLALRRLVKSLQGELVVLKFRDGPGDRRTAEELAELPHVAEYLKAIVHAASGSSGDVGVESPRGRKSRPARARPSSARTDTHAPPHGEAGWQTAGRGESRTPANAGSGSGAGGAGAGAGAGAGVGAETGGGGVDGAVASSRGMCTPTRPSTAHAATDSPRSFQSPDGSVDEDEDADETKEMEVLEQMIAMEREKAAFGSEQDQGEQQLRDYDTAISAKERTLVSLKARLQAYHRLRQQYDVLLQQVKHIEDEKAELLAKSQATKASKQQVEASKKRLLVLESELKRLRSQRSQQRNMIQMASREARRAEALSADIRKLKEAKVRLLRKQKEAETKHKMWLKTKAREIQALRRAERKRAHQVSALQIEARRQSLLLSRKTKLVSKVTLKLKATEAQLLALLERQRRRVEDSRHRVKRSKGKRLRKQQRDTSASRRGGGAPTSKSARKTKTKRTANSQRRERSQSHPETGSESDAQPAMAVGKERSLADITDMVEAKKRLLDDEIAARVRALEAEQALSSALSRRADVLRSLMQAVEKRDALVTSADEHNNASSSSLGQDDTHREALVDAEREIEALETKVAIVDARIEEAMASMGGVAANVLSDVATADEALPEAVLADPDDRAAEATADASGPGTMVRLNALIRTMSVAEARMLLKTLVLEAADTQGRERISRARRFEAERAADAARAAEQNAKKALATVSADFSRRMHEMQQQYEDEVLALLRETAAMGDGGDAEANDAAVQSGDPTFTHGGSDDGGDESHLAVSVLQRHAGQLADANSRLQEKLGEMEAAAAAHAEQLKTLESRNTALIQQLQLQQAATADGPTPPELLASFAEEWEEVGLDESERQDMVERVRRAVSTQAKVELAKLHELKQASRDELARATARVEALSTVLGEDDEVATHVAAARAIGQPGSSGTGGVGAGLQAKAAKASNAVKKLRKIAGTRFRRMLQLADKAKECLSALSLASDGSDDQGSAVAPPVRRLLELVRSVMQSTASTSQAVGGAATTNGAVADPPSSPAAESPQNRRLSHKARARARLRARAMRNRHNRESGGAPVVDTAADGSRGRVLSPLGGFTQLDSSLLNDVDRVMGAGASGASNSMSSPVDRHSAVLDEWSLLPEGSLCKANLDTWEAAVRQLSVQMGRRRWAAQLLAEQVRLAAMEAELSASDLLAACKSVGLKRLVKLSRACDTMRTSRASQRAEEARSQAAAAAAAARASSDASAVEATEDAQSSGGGGRGSGRASRSSRADSVLGALDWSAIDLDLSGLAVGEGDGSGDGTGSGANARNGANTSGTASLDSAAQHVADVLSDIAPSAIDASLLRRTAEQVLEAGGVLYTDAASLSHLQLLATMLMVFTCHRARMLETRVRVVRRCFDSARKACEDTRVVSRDDASSATSTVLLERVSAARQEWDSNVQHSTPLSLGVAAACTDSLGQLYRLLARVIDTGSKALAVCWEELRTTDEERRDFWTQLTEAATTEADRWVAACDEDSTHDRDTTTSTLGAPPQLVHMLCGAPDLAPEDAHTQRLVNSVIAKCLKADAAVFSDATLDAPVGDRAGALHGVAPLRKLWLAGHAARVGGGGGGVPVVHIDITNHTREALQSDGRTPGEDNATGSGGAAVGDGSNDVTGDGTPQEDGGGGGAASLTVAELVRIVALQALVARGIAGATTELDLRSKSIRSIMGLLDQITDLEGRIRDFEERSSDKSRFKGSSLVFLQEEKFRRSASTQYPRMLRRLHKDVSAWEEEQGQPFVVAGVELRPKLAELISEGQLELLHLSLSRMGLERRGHQPQAHDAVDPPPAITSPRPTSRSRRERGTTPRRQVPTARPKPEARTPSRRVAAASAGSAAAMRGASDARVLGGTSSARAMVARKVQARARHKAVANDAPAASAGGGGHGTSSDGGSSRAPPADVVPTDAQATSHPPPTRAAPPTVSINVFDDAAEADGEAEDDAAAAPTNADSAGVAGVSDAVAEGDVPQRGRRTTSPRPASVLQRPPSPLRVDASDAGRSSPLPRVALPPPTTGTNGDVPDEYLA